MVSRYSVVIIIIIIIIIFIIIIVIIIIIIIVPAWSRAPLFVQLCVHVHFSFFFLLRIFLLNLST